nr:hypothetical protein [Pseudobdellovibrionaceae bacterium]
IDILIQTKHLFYIVEIKYSSRLSAQTVLDVEKKELAIKTPPKYGVKKVLICKSSEDLSDEFFEFFDKVISFKEFLG